MNEGIAKAKQKIQDCLSAQSESLDLSYCKLTTLADVPELFDCMQIKMAINTFAP